MWGKHKLGNNVLLKVLNMTKNNKKLCVAKCCFIHVINLHILFRDKCQNKLNLLFINLLFLFFNRFIISWNLYHVWYKCRKKYYEAIRDTRFVCTPFLINDFLGNIKTNSLILILQQWKIVGFSFSKGTKILFCIFN